HIRSGLVGLSVGGATSRPPSESSACDKVTGLTAPFSRGSLEHFLSLRNAECMVGRGFARAARWSFPETGAAKKRRLESRLRPGRAAPQELRKCSNYLTPRTPAESRDQRKRIHRPFPTESTASANCYVTSEVKSAPEIDRRHDQVRAAQLFATD